MNKPIQKQGEKDEYGIDQEKFYRIALHSKLLCTDKDCDVCCIPISCGFVEVNYPVDTSGKREIWKCFCKTTACNKQIC